MTRAPRLSCAALLAFMVMPASAWTVVTVVASDRPEVLTVAAGEGDRREWVLPGLEALPACAGGEDYRAWFARVLRGTTVPFDAAGVPRDAKGRDLRVVMVRAGYAVAADLALSGYLDEAIAEGAGYWGCAARTVPFERAGAERGIHPTVLLGIAMNESARRGRPWPWTLNVGGQGFYFQSREAAWRAANWLLARGQRSFDIGMMQVNWKYHGHRFGSTWEALQPAVNVRVGADILAENYRQTGNWTTAVRWYHNRTDEARGAAYLARFLGHFRAAVVHTREH